MLYRLMAMGEDGMEFCIKNNVPDHNRYMEFDKAEEQYPCAQLWWEKQT